MRLVRSFINKIICACVENNVCISGAILAPKRSLFGTLIHWTHTLAFWFCKYICISMSINFVLFFICIIIHDVFWLIFLMAWLLIPFLRREYEDVRGPVLFVITLLELWTVLLPQPAWHELWTVLLPQPAWHELWTVLLPRPAWHELWTVLLPRPAWHE